MGLRIAISLGHAYANNSQSTGAVGKTGRSSDADGESMLTLSQTLKQVLIISTEPRMRGVCHDPQTSMISFSLASVVFSILLVYFSVSF